MKTALAVVALLLTLVGCGDVAPDTTDEDNNAPDDSESYLQGEVVPFPDGTEVRCVLSKDGEFTCEWN